MASVDPSVGMVSLNFHIPEILRTAIDKNLRNILERQEPAWSLVGGYD